MNQFLYIILKVFYKATNTNPPKNRQSGRQQLLEKGKKNKQAAITDCKVDQQYVWDLIEHLHS